MDKRYQVFVSSTFADLEEERRMVIQTLMEMDCIPSGMELFPAVDEEQFEFIKRVIDDSDYYLLIVGGKYGSMTLEGVSFTEKEYDYALSKDLKILAFLHGEPDQLTVEKSETDPESQKRLKAFRERVASGRLVRFWRSAEELAGAVALSLQKTIKIYPAVGWVRADQIPTHEVLERFTQLEQENQLLRTRLGETTRILGIDLDELAHGSDKLPLAYTYELYDKGKSTKVTISDSFETTWDSLFSFIAPYLIDKASDSQFQRAISEFVSKEVLDALRQEHGNETEISGFTLSNDDLAKVKVQFRALGLVQRTGDGWSLTDKGDAHIMQIMVIRRNTETDV